MGTSVAMTGNDEATPYDGDGRVEIRGCPGWRYLPFEAGDDGGPITITAEGPEGDTVTFSVPTYVSKGEELGEITRLVVAARVRMERSAGLGS